MSAYPVASEASYGAPAAQIPVVSEASYGTPAAQIPVAQALPQAPPPLTGEIPQAQPILGYGTFDSPMQQNSEIPVINGESKDIAISEAANETLDNATVLESLRKAAAEHCCWSQDAIKYITVVDKENFNSYDIKWETWVEKRSTEWKRVAYENQTIDNSYNGRAPGPWEITVNAPLPFDSSTVYVHVPHTDSVGECPKCYGRGGVPCSFCHGRGYRECISCHGTGRGMEGSECLSCHGRGSESCRHCRSTGYSTCEDCKGNGRVLNYVELTVEFTNKVDHSVVDDSGLPANLIKKSEGIIVCQETGYKLLPPSNSTNPRINEACKQVFQQSLEHINKDQTRLLQQRVTVTFVPIVKCKGSYKDKEFPFYSYGVNNDGYCDDYPVSMCGCCNIL